MNEKHGVMLCLHGLHPTDPGNYIGLVRCTETPGHPGECEFAWFEQDENRPIVMAREKTSDA